MICTREAFSLYTHPSTRIGAVAALFAAAWIHVAGRDRAAADNTPKAALQRAADAWDKGDYVAALTAYQDLLSGPDAPTALEPIALQTGELFRTIELTADGANPSFSPDSRYLRSKPARVSVPALLRVPAARRTCAPSPHRRPTSPRSTAATRASARTGERGVPPRASVRGHHRRAGRGRRRRDRRRARPAAAGADASDRPRRPHRRPRDLDRGRTRS